ncbi:Hypothetical_protein [Hexamita inflata]|uniref:Hypothetical_protein n=1 Tax=Hexamita inflata TaxID=28002 RepID=A0AA86QQG1_9EUKA|nr:Hypothetical protein HINF_LOCUS51711 [Hexamita inflata]
MKGEKQIKYYIFILVRSSVQELQVHANDHQFLDTPMYARRWQVHLRSQGNQRLGTNIQERDCFVQADLYGNPLYSQYNIHNYIGCSCIVILLYYDLLYIGSLIWYISQKSIQINQNEILLSLTPAIQEEIQMELRMPNNSNKNPPKTKRTNCLLKKSDPRKSQTRQLIQDAIPRFNLEKIRNNANAITCNSPTQQKLTSTKRSLKLTPLVRQSQRRFCEEV